ncbi:MAG: hypothetical protein U9N42_04605 [Campylobacterota bacterium]|nr:hypothetical protein [Campylobacterota bacterium]
MNYPEFFNDIEKIVLKDELSAFLGTFENGEVEFSYLDVVKSAGHSCPTVAGAYLSTLFGLSALHVDEVATRGNIKVYFKDSVDFETTGVVANVISNITGAASDSGFKGIKGNFARDNLMQFSSDIDSFVRFERIDNGKIVDVYYDPSSVAPSLSQMKLMQLIMSANASSEEKIEFGRLWQDRVKRVFENRDMVISTK